MKSKITKILMVAVCAALAITAFAGCGSTKFDENKAIIVVAREEGSGTRDAFMELVFDKDYLTAVDKEKFGDIEMPTNHVTQTSTLAVLTKIETDPQAIAYDSFGYVTDKVKMLKVDGVECSIENIRNADYKIMRPFSVVYKEERLTTEMTKFMEFMTSSNAQPIISADGLIGLGSDRPAYEVLDGLSGTIKISGGTAVKILVDKLVEEFVKLQPGMVGKITVSGGGSGTGRNNVRDDTVDLGMVGTGVTSGHITSMQEKGGTIAITKLCDDGIAVIVNKKNTLDNITLEQLQNIYDKDAETKYTCWADLNA